MNIAVIITIIDSRSIVQLFLCPNFFLWYRLNSFSSFVFSTNGSQSIFNEYGKKIRLNNAKCIMCMLNDLSHNVNANRINPLCVPETALNKSNELNLLSKNEELIMLLLYQNWLVQTMPFW